MSHTTQRTPGPRSRNNNGFTLTELMIVIVIIAVLATITTPSYYAAAEIAKVRRAIVEMRRISYDILSYQGRHGVLPDDLDEVGHGDQLDPWGRPYEYLALETVDDVVVPKKPAKKTKKKKKKAKKKRHKRAKKKWKPDPENQDQNAARLDKDGNPINVLFDLYSAGRDGSSDLKLSARDSQDDVVLARNGDYIGLASRYE